MQTASDVLRGRDEIGAYDRMWDTWAGFSWKPCLVATIFYTLADGLIARAEFEPGRSPQLAG